MTDTTLFSDIGNLDPQWLRTRVQEILDGYPPTDYGNNSGKFYKNYETYWFHKSSSLELIQNFVSQVENFSSRFKEIYSRELEIEFLFLSRIRDSSVPASLFHKDGYFWNGIFHLTIEGQSNIDYCFNPEVCNPNEIQPTDIKNLKFESGHIWYFNSTPFYHKIGLGEGERLELCAPCSMHPSYIERCHKYGEFDSNGYIGGNSLEWKQSKTYAKEYVLNAIFEGTASNSEIAEFSADDPT